MKISEKLLYLVNTESYPICRDAMIPYAKSLGMSYDSIHNWRNHPDKVFIIDCGWQDDKYSEGIKDLVLNSKNKYYFRVVDDYSYDPINKGFMDFIENNCDDPQFISPYTHVINNKYVPIWIPYHYDETNEFLIMDNRSDQCILTGANNIHIYPLRYQLFEYSKTNRDLVVLNHPGYDIEAMNKGIVGNNYLKKISEFMSMIVTTCYLDYELLKYVECAQSGCVPIGEFPKSLLIKLPKELKPLHIFNTLYFPYALEYANKYYRKLATSYRSFIKSIFNKDTIIQTYNNLIDENNLQ